MSRLVLPVALLSVLLSTAIQAALMVKTVAPKSERGIIVFDGTSAQERSIIIINDKTTPTKPGMIKGVVTAVGTDAVDIEAQNGKTYRFHKPRNNGLQVGDLVGVEVDPTGD